MVEIFIRKPIKKNWQFKKDIPPNVEGYLVERGSPLYETFKNFVSWEMDSYFDIKGALLDMGFNSKDLEFSDSYYDNGWVFKFINTSHPEFHRNGVVDKKFIIEVFNPKKLQQSDLVLYSKPVGYYLQGANQKFYDDGVWGNGPVIDKKTLVQYWKSYFSEAAVIENSVTHTSKNVIISNTTELTAENNSVLFKKNVVDRFKEGQHYIILF
jgi:hypothetical protein